MSASRTAVIRVELLVERAMNRLERDKRAAFALPYGTPTELARRCARLAPIFARAARWWEVFARADVSTLSRRAAILAAAHARSDHRFWQEQAVYCATLAEGGSHDDADRAVRAASRSGWAA